jgi:hypothetical protein
MGRRWALVAVAMLAWITAGCAGTAPIVPPVTLTPAPPVPTGDGLHCGDAIDVMAAAPTDMTVFLGAVALPTGRVLQTGPSGESDPAARLFAKQGLVVRVGAVVDLRIGDGQAGHARIAWGNPGIVSDHVRVEASGCPQVSTSHWIAFAGGYYVDEPMCLPVTVESGGLRLLVRIAVGAPCPPA